VSAAKPKGKELRELLSRLREERGAIVEGAVARNKARQATRKKVRAAMTAGAATVPAIAAAAELGPSEVLWYIAALRKYGELVETGQEGDYPTYALKPDEPAVARSETAKDETAKVDAAGEVVKDDPAGETRGQDVDGKVGE
jgi:hypothetical protein